MEKDRRGLSSVGLIIAIVLYVVGGVLVYSALLVTGVYGSALGFPAIGSTQSWEGIFGAILIGVGVVVAWVL